tara:strand:+ start:117 stop:347 length:231 start_codon:yes stop_codon:yes gene_type:complete
VSADEQEFITNALRACQDVQNRFYSERIKVGDINPEEPWWLSKVSLIAKNAELFLQNNAGQAHWPTEFKNHDKDGA